MERTWTWAALCVALVGCSADTVSGGTTTGSSGIVGNGSSPGNGGSFMPVDGATDGGSAPGPGVGMTPTGPEDAPSVDDLAEVCEEQVVRADPVTPDMLIVLDRSGSMQQEGRWTPSQNAVKSITAALDEKVRFGLMMFPKDNGIPNCIPLLDPNCPLPTPGGACEAGDIDVPVDAITAPAIATAVDGATSNGGTPTGPSLENALAQFANGPAAPDTIPTPQFVLLVTDGQPTCPSGNGNAVNQADIDQANNAIDALAAADVPTYVIGYDTQNDAELAAVLDEFALRGGTGAHRPVEDEASLLAEFENIAGEIVSCSFQLMEEPADPTYVLVELDGQQRNYNDPDGWTIDGTTVELQGEACATLQDGNEHLLSVQVQCAPVQPI